MNFIRSRSWMYNRTNPGRAGLTDEFVVGVKEFVQYACTLSKYENEGVIRCPCKKCKSTKVFSADDVMVHLYKHGFKPKYWCWTDHGEVEPPEFHSILTAYMHEQRTVRDSFNAESSNLYHDMLEAVGGVYKRRAYGLGPLEARPRCLYAASSSTAVSHEEYEAMKSTVADLTQSQADMQQRMQQMDEAREQQATQAAQNQEQLRAELMEMFSKFQSEQLQKKPKD